MSQKAACLLILALGAAAPLMAACSDKGVEAPLDTGVCYHAAPQADKKIKFNKVADHVQNLEYCAAELEKMRLRFLGLGGNVTDITGSYQGHYIFLPPGPVIYTAETLNGPRYVALVRYGNKLVLPGAVPQ